MEKEIANVSCFLFIGGIVLSQLSSPAYTLFRKALYSFELSTNGKIRGCIIRKAKRVLLCKAKAGFYHCFFIPKWHQQRGGAGQRLWKRKEKQPQNTVKRNNQGDHWRPGRRVIRILKRKAETFRISFHWGREKEKQTGEGRGLGF